MLKWSDILDIKCIKLNLTSRKKKDVIKEIVSLLYQANKIKNPQKIEQEIIQREKIGTTGIGGGIAIPHILTKEISQTVMALGRKKEGLKFEAIDDAPVQLIFLLVGPEGEESLHLKLLCKLSRVLHNTRFKKTLIEAEKEEELLNVFKRQEEKEE